MHNINRNLPTAEQLERLPLRAVVAYAGRNAQRLGSGLRGVVANEVLDYLFQEIESVYSTHRSSEADKESIVRAAEKLVAAYEDAPMGLKSLANLRIVFCLGHAATAAELALVAAAHPEDASFERKHAADEAQRTVRPIEGLSKKDADAMTEAARRDYETLVREYGEHEDVVIGEPISCFVSSV